MSVRFVSQKLNIDALLILAMSAKTDLKKRIQANRYTELCSANKGIYDLYDGYIMFVQNAPSAMIAARDARKNKEDVPIPKGMKLTIPQYVDAILACKLMDTIHPRVILHFVDMEASTRDVPLEKLTDKQFQLRMNMKRDWYSGGCAICLDEEMLCGSCPARHAIMFRPCGHVICSNGCEKMLSDTCPICREKIVSKFPTVACVTSTKFMIAIENEVKKLISEHAMMRIIWEEDDGPKPTWDEYCDTYYGVDIKKHLIPDN